MVGIVVEIILICMDMNVIELLHLHNLQSCQLYNNKQLKKGMFNFSGDVQIFRGFSDSLYLTAIQ